MQAGRWLSVASMALMAAALPAGNLRADDDVDPGGEAVAERRDVSPRGVDLAAHVDINVVLPPQHWQITGGLEHVVLGGAGRLVVEGNLTIGGAAPANAAERVRQTDEVLLARLRHAQGERLAGVAADPTFDPAQRRRLELATEADILRVLADVARLRQRYAGRRAQLGDDEWQRFQKDVAACRREVADPFGDDSLFAAVRTGFTTPVTDR